MRETHIDHYDEDVTIKIKRIKKNDLFPRKKRSCRVQRNRKALFLWSLLSIKVIACVSLRRSSKFESEMRLFTDSINCNDEAISRRTQRCASEGVVERRAVAVYQGARVRVLEEPH